MQCTKGVFGVIAVAGLAFALGRVSTFVGGESVASANTGQDTTRQQERKPATLQEAQQNQEMEAWMKAGQPGKNHQYLNQLVGDWNANIRFWMAPNTEPHASTGSVTREWILGGRFLREEVEGTSEMGTYNAVGFLGFNNIDQQYEMAWLDDHSSGIHIETATYNPETKKMTFRGAHREPSGRVVPAWGEFDLSNANRHTYVGYSVDKNGKEFKHFEGTFEKRN